jgi:hypothetical protein
VWSRGPPLTALGMRPSSPRSSRSALDIQTPWRPSRSPAPCARSRSGSYSSAFMNAGWPPRPCCSSCRRGPGRPTGGKGPGPRNRAGRRTASDPFRVLALLLVAELLLGAGSLSHSPPSFFLKPSFLRAPREVGIELDRLVGCSRDR